MELLYRCKGNYDVIKFTMTKESSQLLLPSTDFRFYSDKLNMTEEFTYVLDTSVYNVVNTIPENTKPMKILKKLEKSLEKNNKILINKKRKRTKLSDIKTYLKQETRKAASGYKNLGIKPSSVCSSIGVNYSEAYRMNNSKSNSKRGRPRKINESVIKATKEVLNNQEKWLGSINTVIEEVGRVSKQSANLNKLSKTTKYRLVTAKNQLYHNYTYSIKM